MSAAASSSNRLLNQSPSFSYSSIDRPQTASPSKRLTTPSPVIERAGTPIPVTLSPMNYSFTFPCKTCMIMHSVTYIQKDESTKEYSVSSPDGCFKAFEIGKSMLNNLLKEIK